MYAKVEVVDRFSTDMNYIEAFVDFDGTDTYLSEYYFDNQALSYSSSKTGILSAVYDSNAGIVSLTAQNVGISSLVGLYDVRSTVVGFGTTTAGIGTYRYLVNNQPPGSEKSIRIESTVGFGTDAVRVGTFDLETVASSNSIVRVSAGETSALHQVSILSNKLETVVTPGPFAAVNNITDLEHLVLKLMVQDTISISIQMHHMMLRFKDTMKYSIQSKIMIILPNQIHMDLLIVKFLYDAYDGINGLRANRTQFRLTHEGDPIYVKGFDPSQYCTD